MTTHAVGSLSPVPAASKGAPSATTPASTAAAPFEHQLQAARQRGGPATSAHAADHGQRAERGPDPERGRNRDPSPPGSPARRLDASASRLNKSHADASAKRDPASTSASAAVPAAKSTAALLASTAPPVVEAVTGATAGKVTPAKPDTDASEQGAAALVGAILGMLGPAANQVLTPGAGGLPGTSGHAAAADTGTAVLQQGGAAAALALSTSMTSSAVPGQGLAANGLSLDSKSVRDSTKADTAPALVLLSAPAAAVPAAPVSVPIAAPVGGHAFAQELAQQLSWFVGQDVQQARIRLHPEELGSLDLKISVNHGRVDVLFHTQHPAAVTAVQQSLPQLDQMLAQHGLSLGHTEVGQHDRGDQSGPRGHGDGTSGIDEVHGPGLVTPLSQLGLLDAFA